MENNSNIDKALQKGYLQLENGDIQKACETYRNALKRNPDSIALLNNLAQASKMMGNGKESRYYYRKLIDLCDGEDSREMLMLKANSQMNTNNLTDARKTYQKVLDENPNDIPALFQMAEIYKETGNLNKSNAYLDRILAEECENIPAIIMKGENFSMMEEYEDAIKFYDRALEISPEHEDAIRLKGELLKQIGDKTRLQRHIDSTLKIKPDSAYTLMLKAMECAGKNDDEKALEYFNLAISADPLLDEAYFRKAGFLMLKKRYDEAIECYRQAFEINPESGGITDKDGVFELLNQMKSRQK